MTCEDQNYVQAKAEIKVEAARHARAHFVSSFRRA